MTPFIGAAQAGKLESVKWLIGKGADIHAQDKRKKDALYWAKRNGHEKVVEFLESKL